MQYRNLYLAGDAAHLVPPVSAKGMNLALYDVDLLAQAILRAVNDRDRTALDAYSETCLQRIWKYQEFGVWMADTMHDAGNPAQNGTFRQMIARLGATRSFSRPHVSDDNAFSEAQFKTLKYQPDYPGRFHSELHARGWLQQFFGWHNDEHHHAGLALFTPADVFFRRVEHVLIARQAALDSAYAAHPERFPHGAPLVPLPPAEVYINPLMATAVSMVQVAVPPVVEASMGDSAPSAPRTRPRGAGDRPPSRVPAAASSFPS
jgi:hypothetical protein